MVESFKDIQKNRLVIKPPAYPWQDLALRVIDELGIPRQKRNAVFRVCKLLPKRTVEKALNETKELAARTPDRWRYFFKVVENRQRPLQNKK